MPSQQSASQIDNNYALMIRYTMRAFTRVLQDVATQHGITAAEFRVLRTLSETAGVTQVELAKLAAMDRPYAASLVKQLGARGLIKRSANKEDRRRMDLELSARGTKLLQTISVQLERANKIAIAGTSAKDLAIFSGVIKQMQQNLDMYKVEA